MLRIDSPLNGIRVLILVLFGALLGAVLFAIWPFAFAFKHSSKDWIEAVTAIGTVGAVLAALFLHKLNGLNREKEERYKAAVSALRLESGFKQSFNDVTEVAKVFLFGIGSPNVPVRSVDISRLSDLIRGARRRIRRKDLERLLPLSPRAVHMYTQALAILDRIEADMINQFQCLSWSQMSHSWQQELLEKWDSWINCAGVMMRDSKDILWIEIAPMTCQMPAGRLVTRPCAYAAK